MSKREMDRKNRDEKKMENEKMNGRSVRVGKKLKKGFRSYLNAEIVIDYKTCTYFFCILFFYCVYLLCHGIRHADIVYMAEMLAAAYFISYIQVYCFHNFDEADRLGKRDIPGVMFCTGLYGAASYGFKWFDRSWAATLLFLAYVIFGYYVMYLANKIKRAIDTENLNKMLAEFKEGEAYEAEREKCN